MAHKETDPSLEPALRDVDSIQNLDTARLALRWALERMRALEKRVSEVESAAKAAEDGRARAAAELDGARDLLARRANEGLERERYYAKIEEYLNLKLEGGLNPATMAQREARIDKREAELQARETEAESRVREAKSRFEEETRRIAAEAAASAELRVAEGQKLAEKRAAAVERDLAQRLLGLHEKEAQLSALERSLEERRRRFEEFFAAQRAALKSEASAINQAAADQASYLESRVEAALVAKASSLERAWQADKQILMEELAFWRAKAREHMPALLEAQRNAAALEGSNSRLAGENRLLLETKDTLANEMLRWRQEVKNDLPAMLAAVRRAVEAEENVTHLEAELAMTRRSAEEALAELISRDLEDEKLREELRGLSEERTAALRAAEKMRADVLAQRDELKKVIADYRAKARALENGEAR